MRLMQSRVWRDANSVSSLFKLSLDGPVHCCSPVGVALSLRRTQQPGVRPLPWVRNALRRVQAWHDSFDPEANPTARDLVSEWQQRLNRSRQQGGQLHFQYHTVFDALLRARMGRSGEAIWTAVQCVPTRLTFMAWAAAGFLRLGHYVCCS